ncbi:hypothetical protein [Mesoterricola sediminis]|uniref:Uncharacterized protein n=1 Tax=Mesoterricola sediminis TaxID=2927980 RepID=A0AA48KCF8_9BACT|nr:hypothetical protein [Mesoterricola sediminis]BDU77104.1 hypothetical protein METESE_20620 [Mesoterricola sediminis]
MARLLQWLVMSLALVAGGILPMAGWRAQELVAAAAFAHRAAPTDGPVRLHLDLAALHGRDAALRQGPERGRDAFRRAADPDGDGPPAPDPIQAGAWRFVLPGAVQARPCAADRWAGAPPVTQGLRPEQGGKVGPPVA